MAGPLQGVSTENISTISTEGEDQLLVSSDPAHMLKSLGAGLPHHHMQSVEGLADANAKDDKASVWKIQDNAGDHDPMRMSTTKARSRKILQDDPMSNTRDPLNLLDLPLDILREIFKEVRHTNDLTALALTHSALHNLAIEHIYSRFDIVWPESTNTTDSRSGVDALTYGLATLVMAEEIFRHPGLTKRRTVTRNRYNANSGGRASETTVRRRRGNYYAQFTKKFSLGNGPPDWVAEYYIHKEGGKMLGTLVALAIARMRSLETFIWDMPTGVLRDVWLSLASLGDYESCRLEKVWVRWHDNTNSLYDAPSPVEPPDIPQVLAGQAINTALLDRVEHPNFSTLPPLKSLNVMDIDELSYLDEMAMLLGESIHILRELRVGLAYKALAKDWSMVWDEPELKQVDLENPEYGSITIGEKRLGGVLGILVGHFFDLKSTEPSASPPTTPAKQQGPSTLSETGPAAPPTITQTQDEDRAAADTMQKTDEVGLEDQRPVNTTLVGATSNQSSPIISGKESTTPLRLNIAKTRKLCLEILELERVPLSTPVLQNAIDWTMLTSLTLLNCPNHEHLWKTLRRTFAPRPRTPPYPQQRHPTAGLTKKAGRVSSHAGEVDFVYSLNLKKIHTDMVSPALLLFLKETLAPNSLEVLFLQYRRDVRDTVPAVKVEAIYRGPIRRHRASLKKLLIDSTNKARIHHNGVSQESSRRTWAFNREVLTFVCSGKMPSLRELGCVLETRDWHFFLQRLPSFPQIRSLYFPSINVSSSSRLLDNRELQELALQFVNIVTLKPEIELCYIGIENKCFEILENRHADDEQSSRRGSLVSRNDHHHHSDTEPEDDIDDDDDSDQHIHGRHHQHHGHTRIGRDGTGNHRADSTDEEESLHNHDSESEEGTDPDDEGEKIRLREILFYDDKVAIFKARHGRL